MESTRTTVKIELATRVVHKADAEHEQILDDLKRHAKKVARAIQDIRIHMDPNPWDRPWELRNVEYFDASTVYTFRRVNEHIPFRTDEQTNRDDLTRAERYRAQANAESSTIIGDDN